MFSFVEHARFPDDVEDGGGYGTTDAGESRHVEAVRLSLKLCVVEDESIGE